ncbi:MAG TPA: DUF4157 domain-containing protein [Polyangia bacterium]|jgi:hypothetical protein|nr:DUF4157 domain-containing protein [Polyangia bacterium]
MRTWEKTERKDAVTEGEDTERAPSQPLAVNRVLGLPAAASPVEHGILQWKIQQRQSDGGNLSVPDVSLPYLDAIQRSLEEGGAAPGGAESKSEPERIHDAAAHGISGAGGRLPYLDEIQRSFGKHDVRHIEAHTDSPAAVGAQAMGAEAFTTGEHVAFAGAPSLHTAAHEAAHVIQQRAGVQLKGGIGEVGDRYEQHADAVADRVVRGEPTEALLDEYAGAGGASRGAALQLTKFTGKAKGKDLTALQGCHDQTIVFQITDEQLDSKGKLKVPIQAEALAQKIKETCRLAAVPKFTLMGKGINEPGDHTLHFGKKVIKIQIVAPQTPKPRDEAAENERLYAKKEEVAEPAATPEETPQGMLFGTEFTFTNSKMYGEAKAATSGGTQEALVAENRRLQKEWKKLLLSKKPLGLKHFEDQEDDKGNPVVKFTYEDGWWYKCSLDIACIETQTYKMSLGDAREHGWLERLHRDIFLIAEELGLHADKLTGGGHLHLDAKSTFGDDPHLFRDFLVDFCNNPLALEVLENDPTNSPVLGQLREEVRGEFARVLGKFDKKMETYKGTGAQAIADLAWDIERLVYKHAFSHLPTSEQFDTPEKYQALNVRRIVDPSVQEVDKTLEIRAIRAERSVQEFVLIARLLQARIAMLKERLSQHAAPLEFDQTAARSIEHSDPRLVLEAFKKYVEAAKLVWEDYEPLAIANLKERHRGFVPPERTERPVAASSSRGHEPRTERSVAASSSRGHEPHDERESPEGDPLDEVLLREHLAHRVDSEVGPIDGRYPLTSQQVKKLKELGLQVTGTIADGDCAYRSVGESTGLGSAPGDLREHAAQWCETNEELLLATQFADRAVEERPAAFTAAVAAIRNKTDRMFFGDHGDLSVAGLCGFAKDWSLGILQQDGQISTLSSGGNLALIVFAQGPSPHYYGTKK